jgi:hypothetical protein
MKTVLGFTLLAWFATQSAFAESVTPTANSIGNAQPVLAPVAVVPVTSGAGTVKFDALLQAWVVNDTTLPTSSKWDFRLRRSEMKFSGSVAPDTRWFVMIDPAKSLKTGAVVATNDNRILQDLGVAFTLVPNLELTVGQFKTPNVAEGLDSSAELFMPERSFMARFYGERREPGAMMTWKHSITALNVMISNGQGPNVDDTTNKKDLNARLDVNAAENLQLGAFTTAGDFSYGHRARWGANARTLIHGITLRAEGVYANDNHVKTKGWVTEGGYAVTPMIQPVVRYDGFNANGTTADAKSVGLNYYLSKNNSKIQAMYAWLDNMSGSSSFSGSTSTTGSYGPSALLAGSNGHGTLFILSFQAAI